MKITDVIKDMPILMDGGMGTLLQARGLMPGELPERWSVSHSDVIEEIHTAYFNAGSNLVCANTFGANRLKYSAEELEQIVSASLAVARRAADRSVNNGEKWIAMDIGPTGRMLKPYGDLDFEEAVSIFAESVRLGAKYGADLIFIETMSDSYETKAALLAAKENCDLPVFVSNAYGEDGKLMTGADPGAMVALLEGLGADAIGVNCSLGPKALRGVVEEYLRLASVPVLLKPNAGLPRAVNGQVVYDVDAEEFAREVLDLANKGVRALGGCCGTTPAYIAALASGIDGVAVSPLVNKKFTTVSSYTHAVVFGETPILIGERINPTGKKRFKEALRTGDMDYILKEGVAQEEKGVHLLDVNVGLPEIDEPAMLCSAVRELQAILDLPLQIDTADPVAMGQALRIYNGKPLINSVNGKKESMEAILPLAKKYGGVVIALTLDESGIPATAEGRLEIARRILDTAEKYGIDRKDLIFDPLALTVSADSNAACETLRAVEMITRELGCRTSLGVSNVSFGLPARDWINGTFFAMALDRGLSAAIMNPYSHEMMKTYRSYLALAGKDLNCADFIAFSETAQEVSAAPLTPATAAPALAAVGDEGESELQHAIVRGMKDRSAALVASLATHREPLALVQEEIIPALNTVGVGFENKTVYLPQLLMSAEAAKAAFEVIKSLSEEGRAADKYPVILATVKGDIHDIGKNIVKLLLENYGFEVIDLGRDVPPRLILEEVLARRAPLVGLSALMTTTVPAMEETIALLRKEASFCRVMVGGAVLTQDYADAIGADFYGKDAMEAVRYAEGLWETVKSKTV